MQSPGSQPHRASEVDVNVWPAHLPPGARWLPYQARRAQQPGPAPPPPAPRAPRAAARPTLSMRYWRVLLAAAVGAGLIGIGGGMVLGFLVGVH
ncbi:MAG: hypothetical protein E6I13_00370 [Chloroflexi bacterium]|nr:MAG: hypothetical protein E6I13_00370 [Chloroflexota bacterium]